MARFMVECGVAWDWHNVFKISTFKMTPFFLICYLKLLLSSENPILFFSSCGTNPVGWKNNNLRMYEFLFVLHQLVSFDFKFCRNGMLNGHTFHSLAEVSAFEGLPTPHSEVNNTPLTEPPSELNGGSGDKPKRKRKPKKKTHLDESFPGYLRVSGVTGSNIRYKNPC